MPSIGLFHERSDHNIECCFGIFGTTLARSWYMAHDPPSHFDFGTQFEWLSLLLSDQNRVRTAWLHATYYQYRSQITDDKSALEILEQHHYMWKRRIAPINRLPAEIMMHIFRIALDIGHSRGGLSLVCRYWWKLIEGMASAWSSLDIGATTTPEGVQHLLSRAGTRPFTVKIDLCGVEGMEERLHSYLAMAGNKASQWDMLTICSMPQHEPNGQSDDAPLSIQFQPIRQLRYLTIKEPVLSPVFKLPLHNVATTAVGNLMSMELHSYSAVQYLFQPEHASICSSLTIFIAKVPRMDQSVDILHHFVQLEVLDLTNLLLPIIDNGSPLPLAHTLRHLRLKSVSIQWMGGHVFSLLEDCTIIAPLTGHPLHHDVQLPACTNLYFENWNISPIGQFIAPSLDHLRVRSNAWSLYRGNVQVVQLVRVGFGMSLQPKSLSLSVVCKDKVLLAVLQLLPGLVELKLDVPRPTALGKHFFIGLLAKPPTNDLNFDWRKLLRDNVTEWRCTICPSLTVLELNYQQWLRPGDNYEFLHPLLALSWSRKQTATPFQLHVQYKPSMQPWESLNPTFCEAKEGFTPGLSVLDHGNIAHLSLESNSWQSALYENDHFTHFLYHLHVLEITSPLSERTMLNVLPSLRALRELNLSFVDVPPFACDVDIPLARTLRNLSLWCSTLSWMDGRVFTQLQKFDVGGFDRLETFKQKVQMPACTHIVFKESNLEMLPVLQSNFHYPPLDIWEIPLQWGGSIYDPESTRALQTIHAKIFKCGIYRDISILSMLDEVKELELAIDRFGWMTSPQVNTMVQSALNQLSAINHATRKLPCANMKVLKLRLRDVDVVERKKISESCGQMMELRRLAGHTLEKCYIWWEESNWEKAASLILDMENEEVRIMA